MTTKPKYKLTYFNARGRAETTRLLFAAAGVQYEDNRIAREEWAKIKPTMPQNVIPILEVNGETIVQSHAMARYVAREYGMYGKNNLESTRIDQVQETVADLMLCRRIAFREPDQVRKEHLMKKLFEEDGPKYLGFIENLIDSFGDDGYAVSNSLSLADCCIHAVVEFVCLRDKLGDYPKVAACMKKVEENANIAKWLTERPVTEF